MYTRVQSYAHTKHAQTQTYTYTLTGRHTHTFTHAQSCTHRRMRSKRESLMGALSSSIANNHAPRANTHASCYPGLLHGNLRISSSRTCRSHASDQARLHSGPSRLYAARWCGDAERRRCEGAHDSLCELLKCGRRAPAEHSRRKPNCERHPEWPRGDHFHFLLHCVLDVI